MVKPHDPKKLARKPRRRWIGKGDLVTLQKLINAEKSDLFDVLEYVFNSDFKPITREARVAAAQATIFALLNEKQKEFIDFVLTKYIESGVEEFNQEKLPTLITNKYQSFEDASAVLGELSIVKDLFIQFQKRLYEERAA
ncbi:type I restriction-modification enzyme R subunit C-terminal domain-containing protein [uncultured Imperialibacter sp.]|uniref:type I restriction-modification enzyme R subunit C-terminal domain-containing protein n=1 Tax=uncultured Imperialibacter sp. TaxID=1672639 RepID=UPI0030D7FB07